MNEDKAVGAVILAEALYTHFFARCNEPCGYGPCGRTSPPAETYAAVRIALGDGWKYIHGNPGRWICPVHAEAAEGEENKGEVT